MKQLSFVKVIERIEQNTALDGLAERATAVVHGVIKPGAVKDLLHGVPFGHPVHPVEVQIPIGTWTSAAILDLFPGTSKASALLIGVGVVSVVPSAISGWTDWADLHEQQKRVGLVHAAANVVSAGLYTASVVQRLRGKHISGKVLAYAGLGVVSAAGFLGGHLAYRQAAGANHVEDVPHLFPTGWQSAGRVDDIPENVLTRRMVAEQPLLVLRRGADVDVISDVCSHLSAPLDEGELTDVDGEGPCVTCPWHGSVFALKTGLAVHGPATSPQPRFDVRTVEGELQVLLPGAG